MSNLLRHGKRKKRFQSRQPLLNKLKSQRRRRSQRRMERKMKLIKMVEQLPLLLMLNQLSNSMRQRSRLVREPVRSTSQPSPMPSLLTAERL